MHKIIAAAAFVLSLALTSAASSAATITLAYTGTVKTTAQSGMANVTSVGSSVSGTLVLDLAETPIPGSGYNGSGDFTGAGTAFTGTGRFVDSAFGPFRDMTFSAATINTDPFANPIYESVVLTLSNWTQSPAAPLLASLYDLPTDLNGVISYLGAAGFFSDASVQLANLLSGASYAYTFSVDSLSISVVPSVAPTPIPAALPLFASALGGLGFAGWRRRTRRAVAAAAAQ
jgi:hypothetical protein